LETQRTHFHNARNTLQVITFKKTTFNMMHLPNTRQQWSYFSKTPYQTPAITHTVV